MIATIKNKTFQRTGEVKIPDDIVFGRTFTDNLFEMNYDQIKGGWHDPVIKPFSDFSISPACMVLHYAQGIFEGMKAFKQNDGRIALFRPDMHFKRLNRSARRVCIPEMDEQLLLDALKKLIIIERDWIPSKKGYSLYIRPIVIAMDPFLGVRASDLYKLFIFLGPVGPYYPEGFKPVPILATDDYVRAVRKGIGECKTPGNYAASLLAQREAKKLGYSQVLWLDAIEQKYIEEVGTMNIFVHFKDEVATPALTGSILPGVTRMSVIEILKDWGYKVSERLIGMPEVIEEYKKGNVLEIFGTGTAAVISTVGKLRYKDFEMTFSEGERGLLGQKLYDEITGIQYGGIPDKYNWIQHVD